MKKFPLMTAVAVMMLGMPVNEARAVSLLFSGPKTTTFPQQGLVAHGEINENPIFDQLGNSMAHPLAASIGGVYTELTSTDGFDFTTGDELPFTTTPTVSYQASAPAGHGLASIGVTATDSNPLWLAARGFVLDTNVASDYFYDLTTDIEHRAYRGGQYVVYEETAPNTYQEVLAYNNAVAQISINWGAIQGGTPTNSISTSTTGDPWVGPSGSLPLFPLTITNSTGDPIGTDGSTAEGRYAIFPTNGDVFDVTPEPSRALLGVVGLIAVIGRRR